MRRRLSEVELSELDDELRHEIEGTTSPANLTIRPIFVGPVFPIDGYESWQQRWFMGTGLRPRGW